MSTGEPDRYDPRYDDTYQDGPYMVFTERFHLKRGFCCGQGCRHCPYDPRAQQGNRTPAEVHRALADFLSRTP